ncbi:transposase [Mesorhizobium mediterraneum]|uniref:transposase n=1 Tax=Mesorhizobium mediterraneum TaxID=43617 RepID=UPI001AEEA607
MGTIDQVNLQEAKSVSGVVDPRELNAIFYVLSGRSSRDSAIGFSAVGDLGPHFGLTPSKHRSGETDITGSITRAGDAMVRSILYEAATALLTRTRGYSCLKSWGMAVMKRCGLKRATVAVARKLVTVLHRMWMDGAAFPFGKEKRSRSCLTGRKSNR